MDQHRPVRLEHQDAGGEREVGREPSGVVHLAACDDDPHDGRIYSDPVTDHAVRPARARDLPLLAALEDSGLPMFEEVLGDLTGDALASPAVSGHDRAAEPGFILVAGDPAIGFAHVRDLESHAHLDQISVHPEHAPPRDRRRAAGGGGRARDASRGTAR